MSTAFQEVAERFRDARRIVVYCATSNPRLLALSTRLACAMRKDVKRAKIRERYVRTALKKEDQALAVLIAHPEWTDKRIAQEIGCSRPHLYRMPKFVDARKALKEGRRKRRGADVSHDVTPE